MRSPIVNTKIKLNRNCQLDFPKQIKIKNCGKFSELNLEINSVKIFQHHKFYFLYFFLKILKNIIFL